MVRSIHKRPHYKLISLSSRLSCYASFIPIIILLSQYLFSKLNRPLAVVGKDLTHWYHGIWDWCWSGNCTEYSIYVVVIMPTGDHRATYTVPDLPPPSSVMQAEGVDKLHIII